MLIMGGAKTDAIKNEPVLCWYKENFDTLLSEADAKLMIIGYGFGDDHINASIISAVDKGLKLFIIDPRGADEAVDKLSEATGSANLKRQIVSASRRPLSEIFVDNPVEFKNVMCFFD